MIQLNFPAYSFKILRETSQSMIFDPVRKRYVALTPEEWVRQHVIRYLIIEKGFPAGLISVEGSIKLYRTRKRYDVAAFDRNAKPLLIAECKAPEVMINQAVVDQVIRYNLSMEAPFLYITNGMKHLFLEKSQGVYRQLPDLPGYDVIREK